MVPAIVLVEPREEGNIGATARAMANMGLQELLLVRPAVELGRIARAFAVGAHHILEQARIVDSLADALQPYPRIVGTTSTRGRGLPVDVISPRDLPAILRQDGPDSSTAIIFGPEPSGLDNDQLSLCSILIHIPCAPEQPTLNLAQAVLILIYELHLARQDETTGSPSRPLAATAGEVSGLFDQLAPLLQEIGFARDDTFEAVVRDLRRLAARAGPTSREVTILRGICRRAQNRLNRGTQPAE